LLNPDYPIYGADTSFWTLEVDFQKYKAAGAKFVIIKALNGTGVDPYFVRNYTRARDAGVPVSTYQWLLPESGSPVKDQVRMYADLLRDYPHDFVPWLDYEGIVTARDLIRYVDLFHDTTGRPLGVYSTFSRLNDAVPALPDHFASLKLWIARYSTAFPQVPKPFANWDFWQFTESFPSAAYGFPSNGEQMADMNYFNGSAETFAAFCDPQRGGTPEEQLQDRIQWQVPVPPLAPGDKSIQVLKLQDLLVRSGFMTNAQVSTGPGLFGPRTKAALINLQAALGVLSSGIFDEGTRAAVIARYYTPEGTPPVVVTPPLPVPDDDPVEQRMMFDGNAEYRRYIARLSRGDVQYHVIQVDLTHAEIFITPPPRGVSMVPTFLQKYHMDIAINGDGWRYSRNVGRSRLQTTGENASRGRIYGPRGNQASFYLDKRNQVSTTRPASKDMWNALSFPNILVEQGRISPRINRTDIDPRTALGFSRDGRYAILVAVDGKEATSRNARSGMNFSEVAAILVRHGAWIGANQDGGGSTTLAVRDEHDGKVTILNEPCGETQYACRGRVYAVRPVANHFGIRFLASQASSKARSRA
jgi:GH25 family lysozyme M1 (1,4-beta-N-acetylmuramidase)